MAERDYLMKRVFPELQAFCRERMLELVVVDLRWGVTQEEARQGRVIEICMHEIDKSRPYFIGLLGHRYGWTPGPDEYRKHAAIVEQFPWVKDDIERGLSVTEMEIQYGVLRNKAMANRALFYIREDGREESVIDRAREAGADSPDVGASSTGGELSSEAAKLERLKRRIREQSAFPAGDYPTVEALGAMVQSDLMRMIEAEYPDADKVEEEWMVARAQASVAAAHVGEYPGHQHYLSQLDACSAEGNEPVVITAPGGGGKTTLVANWLARRESAARAVAEEGAAAAKLAAGAAAPSETGHRNAPPRETVAGAAAPSETDEVVWYNIVGATVGSSHYGEMLGRLYREVSNAIGLQFEIPRTDDELVRRLPEFLEQVAASARLTIVVDGVENIDTDERYSVDYWLPDEIPVGVRIILTTIDEYWDKLLFAERGFRRLSLEPLSEDQRREFSRRHLSTYGKKLTREQEDRLVHIPNAGLPLVLHTVVEELRIFGSFERLDAHLGVFAACHSVEQLLSAVLDRVEGDFAARDVNPVPLVFSFFACSRQGLSEDEIKQLAGLSQIDWSQVFHACEHLFARESALLRFASPEILYAVSSRYLTDDDAIDAVYERVIEYFAADPESERGLQELPQAFALTGRDEELADYLARPWVLRRMYDRQRSELTRLWAELAPDRLPVFFYERSYAQAVAAGASPVELGRMARRVGRLLLELGYEEDAATFFKRVAEHLPAWPDDDEELCPTLVDAARGLWMSDAPQEALRLLERGRGLFGGSDRVADEAACLRMQGRILGSLDRSAESEAAFLQALSGYQQAHGERSAEVFGVMYDLGELLVGGERDDDGFEWLARGLELGIDLYGGVHPALLPVCRELGMVAVGLDELELAARYLEHAARIVEEYYGESSPQLGDLLVAVGDLRQAEDRTEEALEIYERALIAGGSEKPTAPRLTAANRMSRLLINEERWEEAEDPARAGLSLALSEEMIEHEEAGIALLQFGEVSFVRGDVGERAAAREWVEQALALFIEKDMKEDAEYAEMWLEAKGDDV